MLTGKKSGNLDAKTIITIPKLTDQELVEIVKTLLSAKKRKVTADQEGYLRKQLKRCPSPFMSLILTSEAVQWKSFQFVTNENSKTNGNSPTASKILMEKVEQSLIGAEKLYGTEIIAALCRYIEGSRSGLTETELMDVTSCNRDVMALIDDKLDHLSVTPTYVVSRFPLYLWILVKKDLGSVDLLKEQSLCNFFYLDAALRSCGLNHIIGIYEETLQQILHHDLQSCFHQVLIPSLPSISEDKDQLAGEVIGRLRYTRAQNGRFLNGLVEQAMSWVDNFTNYTLLVPLTYWIRPQRRQLAMNFQLKSWLKESKTVIQPTLNHQHLLVAGQKAVYNSVTPGTICMYHVASNTLVRSFTGHTDRVTSLTLSHGGQFFVSTSNDKTVRTWDLIQGHCIRNLSPHSDKVLCAILTRDDQFIITGSLDSAATVCNLETGRVVRTYPDHTGPVYALALTHHDEFLVTGSGDFAVRVWHMTDGAPLFSRLGGLMAPVTCMSLTSNDAFLMVACEDETIRVFSLCSGTELHELRGHENKVWCLATAADDCQVFAGCSDGNIYCYDLHTGEILEVFDSSFPENESRKMKNGTPVTSLKVSDDGWFLFSTSGDQVHVWNLERLSFSRHQSGGRRLTPIGSDSGIEEDDSDSGREHLTCIAMSKGIIQILTGNFRSNQRNYFKYTACGTKTGVVALWDMEVCQCVWTTVHDLPHMVTVVAFNPEATLVFSGVENGNIAVWDMGNGALFRTYSAHEGPVRGIKPLGDGIRVFSWDSMDSVHLWPLWTPEDADLDLLTTFKGPACFIELASGDHEVVGRNAECPKEIGMWTIVEEGLSLHAKMSHNDDITCLVLSRNGRLLVTGSVDCSLKVWEGETGFLTQVLVSHDGPIVCCAVADDDKTVVSAAEDRLVIVWEIDNGTVVERLVFETFSHSQHPVLADNTGWLYTWLCGSGELLTAFNTHLPILQLEMAADASRISLRLERCPHLPIVCLHNTPAGPLMVTQMPSTSRRKSRDRAHSITSTGSSNLSAGSGSPAVPTQQTSSGRAHGSSQSNIVSPTHGTNDPVSATKASTRLHPRAPSKGIIRKLRHALLVKLLDM